MEGMLLLMEPLKIPKLSLDEWLKEVDVLKAQDINNLIDRYSKLGEKGEERALEEYINKTSYAYKIDLKHLKIELKKLICGHPDYRLIRAKIEEYGKELNLFILIILDVILKNLKYGGDSEVLKSIIILMLYRVNKIGLKLYCKNIQI